MLENTNKAIAINSLVLYGRLIITMLCGFFTTRFSLQALGVADYGLFSVLGSIISFIAIINTIMISTSHRYIAVSIGKGDINETNIIFNICLSVHLLIAVLVAFVAIPLGDIYIYNFLNYQGDISNALMVFHYSIIASIITFVGVPFTALLTAKEKFFLFSIPDILSHLLKLLVSYLLLYYFENKLQVFAVTISLLTVYPTIFYIIYCKQKFKKICRFKFIKDLNLYKEILKFSVWVGYGAIAFVGKSQGAAIIVNVFFSTIMNTALGIANMISSIINNFAQNIALPIAPQITKSYASGDINRSTRLLILSTKLTFLVMFIISSSFFVEPDFILKLWLGDIPDYARMFTILIIADTLIESLNSGIKNIIFANGNIKAFQIIPSTLKIISVIVAYFGLKMGAPAYSVLWVYILFTSIIVITNQVILKKTVGLDTMLLLRESYLPCLMIVVLFSPCFYLKVTQYPIINMCLSLSYLLLIIFLIGLNNNERKYIYSLIHNK